MWDRIRVVHSPVKRQGEGTVSRPGRRSCRQPLLEVLEERQLLTGPASLQPITSLSVPAQQGAVIALLAQSTTTDPQSFTVTSSQPDILASIVQGPFWNVGVSYTDPVTSANSFTGTLTFQLFQNLTPNTVNMITNFTNDSYYVNTGMFFSRIVTNFGGTGNAIVQGGAATLDGTGSSGQPGTPFANENLQQLTFTGTDQLAMANAGITTPTNDTQFFITTGSVQSALAPYNFTIFGQLLTGQSTLTKMAAIPVMTNQASTSVPKEVSQPVNPLTITSTNFSTTNPNGTLVIDASHTQNVGETATITVTAHDLVDNTTATQSFNVTIGSYAGGQNPPVNMAPFANPTTAGVVGATPTQIQLNGVSGYQGTTTAETLSYSLLSQPTHGTVTNFNAATGTLTYTPDTNYTGPDSFTYDVSSTGPEAFPATPLASLPGTVSITVGHAVGDTGAVQVIDGALLITPVPRRDRGTNTIDVAEVPDASAAGGAVIQVEVNGVLDQTQPAVGSLFGIDVFGGRNANNDIVLDPSVQLPATIDSGHGLNNFLTGGGAETREHGWFGHTTLIGGPGTNQLIGLKGRVRFKPSKATNVIFAGVPRRRTALLNPLPPGGTFFKFVKGHLVPVKTV
jgi:cyclophilin family peptidyl-prolyl cis-trans isomerase